jgi:Na+/melibiose symporter-like transporter
MEESKIRKKFLYLLLIVGAMLSAYYLYCLIFFNVNPQIMGYHIQYNNDFPESLAMISFIFYLTATITPLFVSSIKRTHMLGILMTLSCLVTAIFFTQYLTSVWCFFAALISGVIYWILSDSREKFNLEKLRLLKNPFKEVRL